MFRGSIPRGFRFSGQRFIIIAVADVNKNSNITEKCSLKFIQDVCVKNARLQVNKVKTKFEYNVIDIVYYY